jgi:putative ABC transport system permease protein
MQQKLQTSVVAFQAGLGIIVLVGAMLLTRSFAALRSVDVGFQALDTWVVPISGAGPLMDVVVDRVRAIPGVRSAAVTYDHPLRRSWGDSFLIVGRPLADAEDAPSGSLRPFGAGYFETAGIRVVEGRIPDAFDLAGTERYAVINESLRNLYFPEGDAVGSAIDVPSARRILGLDTAPFTIIGVVEDVRFLGPDASPEPAFYLPLSHFPTSAGLLLVRPLSPDVAIVADVRRAVTEAAPGAAVQDVRRLQDVLDDILARPRFNMMLLVTLAFMGLVLSGLGAYGLVGRAVATRVREIGIRMALGADGRTVAGTVLAGALRPLLLGGSVGLLGAAVMVRFLRSLLFGISPGDPVSFVASAVFLVGVGTLAAVVPMLRALSVDPASSLRTES